MGKRKENEPSAVGGLRLEVGGGALLKPDAAEGSTSFLYLFSNSCFLASMLHVTEMLI
jgi:hypothetical protein